MRIILHPEAERELTEAALYYERQQPGLGADFIAAVNEAVADLRHFPYRFRLINAVVRRGLLRRFPYAFFYWEKVRGEEWEILSISHSKRHPLHWIGRHE